ncbi:hypothetical protein I3843_13G007200 [Carya illinoinensis]|nr:hypothetical protein I3843_13G007200 [Carya illinoinensis]
MGETPLPLMALNHVSRLCRIVKESIIDFYTKVLGFVLIELPPAFDYKDEDMLPETDRLDPMNNHIIISEVGQKLKDLNIKYTKTTVEDEEKGTTIDKLIFFNDPDGFMIEICNCENLKLLLAGSLGKVKLSFDRHNPPIDVENGHQSS